MDDPGRRIPALGGLADAPARRSAASRFARAPSVAPVVALMISAARSRPIALQVPAGVTVYEIDPLQGVRIFRQGGAFWDPSLVPQRRWMWAFKDSKACLAYQDRHPDPQGEITHETVPFYRTREKVPVGQHPLEFKVCQIYLFNALSKAVQEELGTEE